LAMNITRPEIVFFGFVGFLIGLFILIARISGWTTLATFYRFSGSFSGEHWRFQSAQMRWRMGYNNCLNIGINESGLYLSVFFPFRFGHPDLFIPWADISMSPHKGFMSKTIELKFRQAPMIPFRVTLRLAQKMEKAAGRVWPAEMMGGEVK